MTPSEEYGPLSEDNLARASGLALVVLLAAIALAVRFPGWDAVIVLVVLSLVLGWAFPLTEQYYYLRLITYLLTILMSAAALAVTILGVL